LELRALIYGWDLKGAVLRDKAERFNALLNGAFSLVPLAELLAIADKSAATGSAVDTISIENLLRTLESCSLGMEPDLRFAAPIPALRANVVLFKEYRFVGLTNLDFILARMEVEIAALVAANDGKIDSSEAQEIVRKIKDFSGLSNAERSRLIAYLAYLVANPPSASSINSIGDRNLPERQVVAKAALDTVMRKGDLKSTDMNLLERTFDRLRLPKDTLQAEVRRRVLTEKKDEPPPIVARGEFSRTIAIPVKKSVAARSLSKLDASKISEIRAETIHVSSILQRIFEPAPDGPSESNDSEARTILATANTDNSELDSKFPGLAPKLAALLEELLHSSELSAAQFSALAHKYGFMPAGALEMINEWSFERFDEPLIDDGAVLSIARHLLASAHVGG
jgi:hypothetical protein